MRRTIDENILILMAIFFSVGIFLVPLTSWLINDMKAKALSRDFKKISFALKEFFYSEGNEIRDPSLINLRILEDRYYLRSDYHAKFGLIWVDKDPKDDGKVSGIVFYKGEIDPVAASKVIDGLVWFDIREAKIFEDYSKKRLAAVIVEVRGF